MVYLYLVVGILILFSLWLALIRFVIKTLRSSRDRQESVLKRLIRYFVSTRLFWIANSELEPDPQKREKKKGKYFYYVKVMSVSLVATALLAFFIGLLNILSDIFAFLIFSLLFAPFAGILATTYIFIWLLINNVDYMTSPRS